MTARARGARVDEIMNEIKNQTRRGVGIIRPLLDSRGKSPKMGDAPSPLHSLREINLPR